MITNSYDIRTEATMGPQDFLGPQQQLCDVCIVTFSHVIYEHVLQHCDCTQIAVIHACNGDRPVWRLSVQGKSVAFYLSSVGAPTASADVIDVNWQTGAAKFILFGSAGSLSREKTDGRYVIPTEAYRDEGTSYHYALPADYIRIRGSEQVAAVFSALGVPYVAGRVWTTDAFYRETRGLVAARQAEGCLAVDMELAGLQAVCDFHGFELYDFLMTGDVLGETEYDRSGLQQANHELRHFALALKLAESL